MHDYHYNRNNSSKTLWQPFEPGITKQTGTIALQTDAHFGKSHCKLWVSQAKRGELFKELCNIEEKCEPEYFISYIKNKATGCQ